MPRLFQSKHSHRKPANPAMPRRGGPPRRRRLPPGGSERRLAEEVLYLHSLWRRGRPAAAAPTLSRSAGRLTTKSKRLRLDGASASAAVEPQDTGPEWPLAPSAPDSSPKTWSEAAPASAPSPAKPPPPPTSPGALAQRDALRAAAEFLSNRGSSSSDDDGGSESEDEQDTAEFITGLFVRDAALRGHYERGWEDGQFACIACAGGTRKPGRRFRGCVALVQHARASTRYGRPRAHRALAAVVCRVLGWDIGRLPSIVIDPRGTLGQVLAAEATADVQLAKENGDTGENIDLLSDEDEKEDVETGMEDSSADGDEEDNELASREESAEKEDAETVVEDFKTDDGDKEAIQLDKAEKFNANTDDSLFQDNNGDVREQEIAKEYTEQDNTNNLSLTSSKDTCKEVVAQEEANPKSSGKEDAKTSVDTAVPRLGKNSSMDENAGENK